LLLAAKDVFGVRSVRNKWHDESGRVEREKTLTCGHWVSEEEPCLGGLGEAQHEEDRLKQLARRAAIDALSTSCIAGKLPEKPGLKDELLRVIRWWDKACLAVNAGRQDNVLLDETQYAPEWCIAIADAIIQEEMNFRQGLDDDATVAFLKKDTWTRFEHLEAGFMSNGVKRPGR